MRSQSSLYLPYLPCLPYLPHLPYIAYLAYLLYLLYLAYLAYLPYLSYFPYIMPQRQTSRINDIFQELNQSRTIPSLYQDALEDRLLITCQRFSRQQRQTVPRAPNEYRSQHQRKKASTVYLKILDCDPHLFLPFILAITPKACETFNVFKFQQQKAEGNRLVLNDSAKLILEDIAKNCKIDSNPHFRRLIEALFPKG